MTCDLCFVPAPENLARDPNGEVARRQPWNSGDRVNIRDGMPGCKW